MALPTSRRWRRRGLLRCEYYLNIVPASRMRGSKTQFSPFTRGTMRDFGFSSANNLSTGRYADPAGAFAGGTSNEPPIRGFI